MVQIGLLGIFFVHWLIAARANVHQNPCEPNGGVRPSNATAIRSELDFLGSIACHDNSTVRNQFLSEIGVASGKNADSLSIIVASITRIRPCVSTS